MSSIEPIHPGEHLSEILDELGISQYRLARAIDVSPRRINDIVHGRRSVTADTALRIGRALAMTPEFWLNLQRMYDLDRARAAADVSEIEPLVAAGGPSPRPGTLKRGPVSIADLGVGELASAGTQGVPGM